MTAAALPSFEADRLALLRELDVLDHSPDGVLDGLTRLASQLTGCPIALVNLVDESQVWLKSRHGLDAASVPREIAFCAHAIVGEGRFEVPDVSLDPRFADNPLVTGEPHVRLYAGEPLVAGGQAIGTLCVMDRNPRHLSAPERSALDTLAAAAAHWFESRLARVRLAQSQARLFDFIEAAADWAFECDRGFGVQWVSAAFSDSAPLPFGLAVGGVLPDAARHNEQGLLHRPFDSLHAALASGVPLRRFIVHDGNAVPPRFIGVSALPMHDAQGLFVGHRGLLKDISEAVQAEAQRQQQHIELEGTTLGREFMLRMSDALRSPLQMMTGHAQLLALDAPAGLPPEAIRHLEHVTRSGRRVRRLLDDMQRVWEAEQPGPLRPPRRVDLTVLARHAAVLHADLAARCGVQLLPPAPVAGPVVALAHDSSVLQVVSELIANGIRFNRRGGSLTLATRVENDRAWLSFTDQGAGLDTAQMARLFHPFERLHDTPSVDGATGLGLLIARAMARAMGGEIRVQSQPGEGSVFSIELPLADAASAERDTSPTQGGSLPSILCIEADPSHARLMRELLGTLSGSEVHVAYKGRDGVALALALKPVLTLVHIRLPDISGFEVVRQLRANPATASLRFVAVAADASAANRQRALEAGFDEFWPKPLHLGHALERLRHWLVPTEPQALSTLED